jgi:NAD(P)-dependent dehydrogenase (short-subunit alcohol dehydrogenase family)
MTRGLARDWGPDGIRVNTVVPGWIMTQRQIDLWLDADGERQLFENQCLKESSIRPTSRGWCCGSPPTTAGCARAELHRRCRLDLKGRATR